MKFVPQTTFHSKLHPGVTVRLRKLSHGMRVRIDTLLADTRSEIRDLSELRAEIIDPVREAVEKDLPDDLTGDARELALAEGIDKRLSREQKRETRDAWSKIQLLKAGTVEPAYLREAVKTFEGLDLDINGDGQFVSCMDVDTLVEHGPSDLIREIYDAISEELAGLSAEARKN